MALSLSSRRVGDVTVVTCAGRIVMGPESDSLQACLDEMVPTSAHVLLHLGAVDFIDSSGLGLLARYLTRAQNANGTLKLCALSPKVDDVLRVTRLKSAFPIHETEADSIADTHRAPSLEGAAGNPDVLCVDPSPDVLAYLRALLTEAGYRAITASNFPDALILLKATRPRVVVISATLRESVVTRAAEEFKRIAGRGALIELPAGFSAQDAGEAARDLLAALRGS